MHDHRSEVRSKYARAVAEYRIGLVPGTRNFNPEGYWLIIVPGETTNKLLGRGETEAAAWEVAALASRIESLLATVDRQPST